MRLEQWESLQELYRRELRENGYQSDPAQLAAVAALSDLRQRLLRRRRLDRKGRQLLRTLLRRAPLPPEPGLYLWGAVGRGKTWLMDMFYDSLPFAQKRRRHFHRFMQDVHGGLKQQSGHHSPLDRVADDIASGVRVLCFDEFYVSDIADAMILGTMLSALFARGVTLVATSNSPPEELYRDGLQRQRFVPAIEQLRQHTQVLNVDGGTDYRLRRLTRAGTYLLTTTPGTGARLAGLYRGLTHGAPAQPGSITVLGRPIATVAHGPQAIWFEFSAICDGPRSTEDYIEVARTWPIVVVADVPVLGAPQDDAVRRFIALVDELYDRRVNLVVTAAAPVMQLYQGERLRFEFQRTISRLTEMQTPEYLSQPHRP
ncbi:MAG TPA: cell division protein ZapE [Steroidobacteraceae bacterium]|nr:cell division protein ZapE [Steroidobacteraceae bacterium]